MEWYYKTQASPSSLSPWQCIMSTWPYKHLIVAACQYTGWQFSLATFSCAIYLKTATNKNERSINIIIIYSSLDMQVAHGHGRFLSYFDFLRLFVAGIFKTISEDLLNNIQKCSQFSFTKRLGSLAYFTRRISQ